MSNPSPDQSNGSSSVPAGLQTPEDCASPDHRALVVEFLKGLSIRVVALFSQRLRRLHPTERQNLKNQLRAARRCLKRIVVWREARILIDGHYRLEIIAELRAEGADDIADPEIEYLSFPDLAAALEWVAEHHRGQRNLTPVELAFLIANNRDEIDRLEREGRERMLRGKAPDPEARAPQGGRVRTLLKDRSGCNEHLIGAMIKARRLVDENPGFDADLEQALTPEGRQQTSGRELERQVRSAERRLGILRRNDDARRRRPPYRYGEGDGIENQILCGDARLWLKVVGEGTATLSFYSPPYPTEYVEYGSSRFRSYQDWLREQMEVLRELYRAIRDGGRVIINVDQTSDGEQTGTRIYDCEFDLRRIAKRIGWKYYNTVAWYKQKTVGSKHRIAWGTYCDPKAPGIRRCHENIIILYKVTKFMDADDALKDTCPDVFEHATVSTWNYDAKNRCAAEQTLDSFWYVPPEKRNGSHPCPFPSRLAEIVIETFSARGDLVIDPYVGSGTTAAAAQRLGRRFIGIDIDDGYCADAQERLRQQL